MLSFRGKIEFSKKRTGKCLAVRSSSFFMPFLRLDKSITLPVSQVNDRADFYWNVRTVSALSKHSETPIYRDKQPIFARFGTRLLRGGRSTPPLTPLTPLARPTVNSPLQSLPLSTFRCSGRAGAYAPRRGRALSRVVDGRASRAGLKAHAFAFRGLIYAETLNAGQPIVSPIDDLFRSIERLFKFRPASPC